MTGGNINFLKLIFRTHTDIQMYSRYFLISQKWQPKMISGSIFKRILISKIYIVDSRKVMKQSYFVVFIRIRKKKGNITFTSLFSWSLTTGTFFNVQFLGWNPMYIHLSWIRLWFVCKNTECMVFSKGNIPRCNL